MIRIIIIIFGVSFCGVTFWTCSRHRHASEAYIKDAFGTPGQQYSQPHTGWHP